MRLWPLTSIVVITYKRLDLLKDTYASTKAVCSYPHLEWIVCDDGSPQSVQDAIRAMTFDAYLLSAINEGMGANTNKGILAANGEFILHLQDDWHCRGPGDFIEAGVELMQEREDVCMVQYWREPCFEFPTEYHITRSGRRACIYLDYPGMVDAGKGFHIYSDRPHLKRSAVREAIGLYVEDVRPVLEVEEDYCRRFEQCTDQRVAIIEGYGSVFVHTGTSQTFNYEQKKANIREYLRRHPVLRHVWNVYTFVRYGRRG
ncbi:glycosyltransferase family 2 protein [Planctomycetota bacterium]